MACAKGSKPEWRFDLGHKVWTLSVWQRIDDDGVLQPKRNQCLLHAVALRVKAIEPQQRIETRFCMGFHPPFAEDLAG